MSRGVRASEQQSVNCKLWSTNLYLRVKAWPIKAVLRIFASLCGPPQSSWLTLENPKSTSKLCLWNKKRGKWQKWSHGEIHMWVFLWAHPGYNHTCVCVCPHTLVHLRAQLCNPRKLRSQFVPSLKDSPDCTCSADSSSHETGQGLDPTKKNNPIKIIIFCQVCGLPDRDLTTTVTTELAQE